MKLKWFRSFYHIFISYFSYEINCDIILLLTFESFVGLLFTLKNCWSLNNIRKMIWRYVNCLFFQLQIWKQLIFMRVFSYETNWFHMKYFLTSFFSQLWIICWIKIKVCHLFVFLFFVWNWNDFHHFYHNFIHIFCMKLNDFRMK